MILITGCTGFIGSHLVNSLIDNCYEVKCLARGTAALDRLPNERMQYAMGDVMKPDSLLSACEGIDTVIHLVGIIREHGDVTFERIHVEGTRNVIDAANAGGVRRIIYMSAIGANERGLTGYQTSKWKAEGQVRNSGMQWIIVRPSIVIGRWGEFVKTLSDLARKGPVIPVIGDGDYKLQPLYVDDLMNAFVKMLANDDLWCRVYEFGGPEILTFNQMIHIVREVMKVRKPVVHLPVPLVRPAIRVMGAVLSNPPITLDQLKMLEADNITEHNAFTEVFGINPKSFREALSFSI